LINELTALPYCDIGNCVGNDESANYRIYNKLIELREELDVKKIDLRGLLVYGKESNSILNKVNTDKVRMILDLPKSSDELFGAFKSKLRSQIRKSEKNGNTFRWGGLEEIDSFYSVISTNMRDLGSPVHSKYWFYSVLENLDKNARLGLIEFEGQIVGGCIILTLNEKISIPWASTLKSYNRYAPNMLLYWSILKFACDNGFKTFDFGRSSIGGGTYQFKAQWGAKAVPLDWYNIYKSEREKIKKMKNRRYFELVWSKLPINFANILGPQIRRYISL
jgi:FemAB-related protein (PEP-CTERM system-associated)